MVRSFLMGTPPRTFVWLLDFRLWFVLVTVLYITFALAGFGWDTCIDVCGSGPRHGHPVLNVLGLFAPVGPWGVFLFALSLVGVFTGGAFRSGEMGSLWQMGIVVVVLVLALIYGERLTRMFAKSNLAKVFYNLLLLFVLTAAVQLIYTGSLFSVELLLKSLGLLS